MSVLKVGFDVHGVVDTFPFFAEMTRMYRAAGHEVHIITGQKKDDNFLKELEDLGVEFTHYYSIVDELESRDSSLVEWDHNGKPHAPVDLWNVAKADYCKKEEITLLFDDSPTYGQFFNDIDTTYCHILNPNRVEYKVRSEVEKEECLSS